MLFNSPHFLFLFLPITLVGFFIVARVRGANAAVAWLVLASLVFYGAWNPRYVLLIALSIGINFSIGREISVSAVARRRRANALLALGVTLNLAALAYFKYTIFIVQTMNDVLRLGWNIEHIVLPLAISFFTFQQIAYLVDARWGISEEPDFLRYCLFVTFFPQLIAGPIVHHAEVLPQFKRSETFQPRWSNIAIGTTIFAVGLFKKVVIADSIAVLVTPIYSAAEAGGPLHLMESLVAVGGYTLQLYFDFSGYSDMAVGLARMFGIKLPINFDSPYKATGVIDFWRRWHMTLSRFLRDYLYFPLGGNQHGVGRRYVNLMIVMLLGGLWHGAGWTFVFWGGLHGVYLIVNHLWRAALPRRSQAAWAILGARSFTLFWVMVAWVFFRAESFDAAVAIFEGFLVLPSTLPDKLPAMAGSLAAFGFVFEGPYFTETHALHLFFGCVALGFVWFLPNTQQLLEDFAPALGHVKDDPRHGGRPCFTSRIKLQPSWPWGIFTGALLLASISHLTRVTEFLYFQF